MVEAQAAARVDRLDQDKDIVILRYIVKDSIEEVFSWFYCSSALPKLISYLADQSTAKTQDMVGQAFHVPNIDGQQRRYRS